MGDALRDTANTVFDPFIETDEERETEELDQQGNYLWQQLYNDAPSAYDLTGYGMYGGQMSDDWFQNWLAESDYNYEGRDPRQDAAPSTTTRYAPGTRTTTTSGAASVDPYLGGYRSAPVSGSGTQQKGGDSEGGEWWEADWEAEGYTWDLNRDGTFSPDERQAARDHAAETGAPWAEGNTVDTSHYGVDRDGNYIAGSEGGSGIDGREPRAIDPEALRSMAEEQWVREQLANDPLAFLNVNQESALASAQADPASIEAQGRYLGDLRGIYDAGGYTDTERAQNQLAQKDASRYEQSQRSAAQQQAAMRGMNQSGAAMMGALSAQQGGANRAADSATQFNIAGHQRALQALQSYGQQANDMRQRSWTEDTTRRTALDNWNQYRTGLTQQRQAQWGGAQGDSYGYRQQSLGGLTDRNVATITRNDQQEQQGKEDMIGAVSAIANIGGDDEDD
jgi:hypothetical protein